MPHTMKINPKNAVFTIRLKYDFPIGNFQKMKPMAFDHKTELLSMERVKRNGAAVSAAPPG
jgi:hypothetical protein